MLQGGSRKANFAKSTPLVSIITVCYNAKQSLPQTIASVAAQSHGDYEFIVIDGASQDGSVRVLEENDHLIDRWISAPDKGIYDAMNKGADLAGGHYLAFLNADDRYLPHTIAKVAEKLNLDVPDVLYGNMIKVREIDGQAYEKEEKPRLEFMPQGMGIFHPAAFVKKLAFETAGKYDTTYRLAADYALFLKLWQEGKSFSYLDAPLAYFSLGGASNAGCGTYAEAVEIQKKYNTGYASQTQKLFWKCRAKKHLRTIIFGLARITGTTPFISRALKRKWA